MIIAKVVGNVTTTHRISQMGGKKLLTVRPVDLDGKGDKAKEFLVADIVGAGIGETVLIVSEGGVATELLEDKNWPTQHIIVAIVDKINRFKWVPRKKGPFKK